MSTSGSTDFSISRDDIIQAAALETGDIALGETLDADTLDAYSTRLNTWVKSLMANGSKLWAMSQATLFLEVGTATYALSSSGAHCSDTYVQTTLSTDEAAGSVSLGLTAFAGMAASDNIGIVLDDGSIFWTTISGAPGAATTIASGLPSAASAGAIVFTYTTKIGRPQRIDPDSTYWRSPASHDTPVAMISRSEYAQLANKVTRGKIVQAYYNPQLVSGELSVWPTPDSAGDVLRFSYERRLEDFDTGADEPDFAIEWGEALILGLAAKMARSAGMPMVERAELQANADRALSVAEGYDRENVSVFFQPDIR